MVRRVVRPWRGLSLLAGALMFASGCETYRIEYHKRPAYYQQASLGGLPDRVTLDDGTVIIYETIDPSGGLQRVADSEETKFNIWEEDDDGEIIMRALLPEHVLANTLMALRNRTYDALWDQMVAESTKMAYSAEGGGVEEFAQFMERNRVHLARTVNRMLWGLPRSEVVVENMANGIIRVRFHPNIGRTFKFRTVDIVNESYGLRLLVIK